MPRVARNGVLRRLAMRRVILCAAGLLAATAAYGEPQGYDQGGFPQIGDSVGCLGPSTLVLSACLALPVFDPARDIVRHADWFTIDVGYIVRVTLLTTPPGGGEPIKLVQDR